LEKTIFSKYIGVKYHFFLNWLRLTNFFIPRSLKTTRNNPTSSHNGTIKNVFFTKPPFLSITSNETVQNSKSKPKNFHSCVPLLQKPHHPPFFCVIPLLRVISPELQGAATVYPSPLQQVEYLCMQLTQSEPIISPLPFILPVCSCTALIQHCLENYKPPPPLPKPVAPPLWLSAKDKPQQPRQQAGRKLRLDERRRVARRGKN
jgi:hypothetical protein